MPPRAAPATPLLAVVILAAALAGCSTHAPRPEGKLLPALAAPAADRWQTGSWWSYHAVLEGNATLDVDLIVDRVKPDGFSLGTNASHGFFGLPFLGNVTKGLNPEIGDEVWPMFQLPLSEGRSWSYHLWGHDAKAIARAALVDVPGAGPEPGFRIEASSLGQVFARYDYASSPGWFTHLEIVDPGKGGQAVLVADLAGFGANYHGLYYVEETLAAARFAGPTALPLPVTLDVPAADSAVRAHLSLAWTAGACDAMLLDEAGRPIVHAQVVGTGVASDGAIAGQGAHHWTLQPRCVGAGSVYVAVTGVRARQGLAG
jgi:hypothetical protein